MKKVFLLIIILIGLIIFAFNNFNDLKNENYSKELVISEENYEEQVNAEVVLYFLDQSNNIISETKNIDANNLIRNPYKYVLNLAKNEEESEIKKNLLNRDYNIIDVYIEKNILNIVVSNNFSEIYSSDISTVKDIFKRISNQFKEVSEVIIKDESGNIL